MKNLLKIAIKKLQTIFIVHWHFINWQHCAFSSSSPLCFNSTVISTYSQTKSFSLLASRTKLWLYFKVHPLLQSEKERGILHSVRSFPLFQLKPVNPQGDRTPLQTACKISLAAPFEKCSLLSSPVLCHSSLWVVVCKMERQLHDLVLLIKTSMLMVCLWPTPKYYCVFIVH